ncbi:MAG: Ribosomal large subunit pseudouridine synthase B [Chlamydiae bacterium]|nr:Ribosomal large subunit pseudouridine synthase B [Chlamydiota bacterium]
MHYPASMEKKRLSKVLASAGIASRRGCESLIFEGKVTVNGKVILKPETHVDLISDDVRVEDRRIAFEEAKVCYILNKPSGYICSNKPMERKKLVIDLFPNDKRLFTVGRLDRDTTGLLLVTNDGHFSQKVIHPSFDIEKEYLVKTQQEITHEHLVRISKGGMVEGFFVQPISCKKVRRGTLKIIVKEGKKREVRVLVQKAGLKILSLSRIRIGSLRLGNIPEGNYREITEEEKTALLKSSRSST